MITRWALAVVTAVGLGFDAYTHFDIAHFYDMNRTSTLNQGVLFRTEAVIAIVAGVLLIVRANLLTAVFALLVAGGGLFLLVLYRYVDVGKIGPLPDMYEPLWKLPYGDTKIESALGEAVAVLGALGLIALLARERVVARRSAPATV